MASLHISVEYKEETGTYLCYAPWMDEVLEVRDFYDAWCQIVARRPR